MYKTEELYEKLMDRAKRIAKLDKERGGDGKLPVAKGTLLSVVDAIIWYKLKPGKTTVEINARWAEYTFDKGMDAGLDSGLVPGSETKPAASTQPAVIKSTIDFTKRYSINKVKDFPQLTHFSKCGLWQKDAMNTGNLLGPLFLMVMNDPKHFS